MLRPTGSSRDRTTRGAIDQGWRRVGPRSLLFVPADRTAELWPKAQRSGADAVILDLEDAVMPARKDEARSSLSPVLSVGERSVPTFVRVNRAGTPWFEADVVAACAAGVDGIILPKAEDEEDVRQLAAVIASAGREGTLAILPLLESAKGILAAREIALADPAVVGLALGAEDLALDIGMRRTAAGREILVSRSNVVLAVAAAGRRWAIDTPSLDLRRSDAVRRDTALAHSLGFTGKLIIHPAQIQPVHDAFRPSDAEIDAAHKIVSESASSAGAGRAIAVEDGRMIDRPIVLAAELVLQRAARAGGIEPREGSR